MIPTPTCIDGWTLHFDEIDDADVRKTVWAAIHDDGRRCDLDWSSYANLGDDAFSLFVRLGFPKRIGDSPLTLAELVRLNDERNTHGH